MRLGLCALALLPLLASCAGAKVQPSNRLVISLDPPELKPGELIEVSASPQPASEMAWVSGTVKVMGAPVMPFRRSEDGHWVFKTMIPAFATLQQGRYEARAWGESRDGRRYEGSLFIDVK